MEDGRQRQKTPNFDYIDKWRPGRGQEKKGRRRRNEDDDEMVINKNKNN